MLAFTSLPLNVRAMIIGLLGFLCFNCGDATLKQTQQFYETEFVAFVISCLELLFVLLFAAIFRKLKIITSLYKAP